MGVDADKLRLARHAEWLASDRPMNANSWMVAERPLTIEELKQVYASCKAVREQRQAMADVAAAELAAATAGVKLEARHLTFNFPRDGRGNLLSAELDFVSQASAFYGATNDEIAMALWPNTTEATLDSARDRVRQMKTTLRKLRVVVGD